MTRLTRRVGGGLAAAALLTSASVGVVSAQAQAQTPTFSVEVLSGPTFTSNPDRLVLVAKIHIPPGGYVDWHRHPGFTSVTVEGEGTFSLMSQNCHVVDYTAGDTFSPPRANHTARNFSDEWVTGRATFIVRGTKPTVMADPATDEMLDARCGLAE